MKLKIFTLCDFAKDYNGQLCINGTFNVLRTTELPTAPRPMSLACQFELCDNIVGFHNVDITITDKQAGKVLLEEKLRLEVGTNNNSLELNRRLYTNLVLNLENMVFNSSGTYEFKVATDEVTETLELYVVKA